jgi:D-alanine-D-alanine ligase-like ATP-grasp enzyme
MNVHPEPTSSYEKVLCPFCGDSEINHAFVYIENTLAVVSNKFLDVGLFHQVYSFFSKFLDLPFEKIIFPALSSLGAVKRSTSIEDVASFRSRAIWEEAERRRIPIRQLLFFGKATDWFQVKINDTWQYFKHIPLPPHLRMEDAYWIDDKDLMKKRLEANSIPTPHSVTVTRKSRALLIFQKMQKPVIVKPRSGSRGRHTTTLITQEDDFLRAFRRAKKVSYYVQIEEHLHGAVCRGTVVDGVLRGFLRAEAPSIQGDGVHSISELIQEKNKNRPEKISPILIKEEMIEFVRRQGYELNDILPRGKIIPLLFRTGRLFGGKTREMLPKVHFKLKRYLEDAARVMQSPLVGFDLIIEAPEADPDAQRWGIIEANSIPFIDLHDFALEGEPANVASYIWDLWK